MRISEEMRKERAKFVLEKLQKGMEDQAIQDALHEKYKMGMGDRELSKVKAIYEKAKKKFGANGVALKNGVHKNGHTAHVTQLPAEEINEMRKRHVKNATSPEEPVQAEEPEAPSTELALEAAKKDALPHLSELKSIMEACPGLKTIGLVRNERGKIVPFGDEIVTRRFTFELE